MSSDPTSTSKSYAPERHKPSRVRTLPAPIPPNPCRILIRSKSEEALTPIARADCDRDDEKTMPDHKLETSQPRQSQFPAPTASNQVSRSQPRQGHQISPSPAAPPDNPCIVHKARQRRGPSPDQTRDAAALRVLVNQFLLALSLPRPIASPHPPLPVPRYPLDILGRKSAAAGTWSQSVPHLFCNPAQREIFIPVATAATNEPQDWSQMEVKQLYLNALTENDNVTFVGHPNPWKPAQFIFNELSSHLRARFPNAARHQINLLIQFVITVNVPGSTPGPALSGYILFLADASLEEFQARCNEFSEESVLNNGIWIPLSVKAAPHRQPRVDIARFVPLALQLRMRKLAYLMQRGEMGASPHAPSLHKATLLLRGGKYAEAVQLLSQVPLPENQADSVCMDL